MKISSTRFLKSAAHFGDCPAETMPEIAFAGRSNVGKSSLINSLLKSNSLAKTSRTPGKTRLINFFVINEAFGFVDLPGYGYARVSATVHSSWKEMVEGYLSGRKSLKLVLLLADSRRGIEEEEVQLMEYLEFKRLPFLVVLTKSDKLGSAEKKRMEGRMMKDHGLRPEQFLLASVKSRDNMARLWHSMEPFLR